MTCNVAPLNVPSCTKPGPGQFASAIDNIVFFGLIYP
jgi:hypothetical protein